MPFAGDLCVKPAVNGREVLELYVNDVSKKLTNQSSVRKENGLEQI